MTVISTTISNADALDAVIAAGNTSTGVAAVSGTRNQTTAATSTWNINATAGVNMQANRNSCFVNWWAHMQAEYPNHTIDTDDIVARFIN